MDSFYDDPRQPPIPTTFNSVNPMPSVPEVSVVENSLLSVPTASTQSCSNGKSFDRLPNALYNRPPLVPNMTMNIESKKQVRFGNPAHITNLNLHQPHMPRFNFNVEKENVPHGLSKLSSNLEGKTFKQIYMANVPNRHLDLSIAELPVKGNYETVRNVCENTPFLDSSLQLVQKNCHNSVPLNLESRTTNFKEKVFRCDNYNYPKHVENAHFDFLTSNLYSHQKNNLANVTTELEQSVEIFNKDKGVSQSADEPTIRDLYKIITQQNEQIMMLQKEVNNLKTAIQHTPPCNENTHQDGCKSQIAFDVRTTNIGVSFHTNFSKFRKQIASDHSEPEIEEIVETESSRGSLHLDESLNVKDGDVSAIQSIKIDLQKFENSDEDENPVNWTDIVDQLNIALKNAQISSCDKKKREVTCQTMDAVKQATLQHFKNIGVTLPPIEESSEFSSHEYSPSEVSFAVKQLLMKYLPDDKLARVINKPKSPQVKATEEKKKLISANSKFSFATYQYLKKYKFIDDEVDTHSDDNTSKFLHLTELKGGKKLL